MSNKITNSELITKLKTLVRTERNITAEIVESIKEIDRLKIYLDYGHTSMFSFLTKEIGYTPAAAQRRIDAARLSKEIPELKEDLKSGTINLSQVSMMAQAVRQKQKEQPDVKVTTSMKKELLEQIQSKDLIATEKALAESLDLNIQVYEKKHYQKDGSLRTELTLSAEQVKNLDRVKELISHQNLNPSLTELIDFLAMSYLKAKDPLMKKPKVSADVNKVSVEVNKENVDQNNEAAIVNNEMSVEAGAGAGAQTSVPVALSRHSEDNGQEKTKVENRNRNRNKREHIPAKVKQEIFHRDQCCQWRNLTTGEVCGSKFQLQIDHKNSIWQGGSNDAENLQVLCSIHNKLKYQIEISA